MLNVQDKRFVDEVAEHLGVAPLEDPDYVPVHVPLNGRVPDVVARWGPKSQLRWFERFGELLTPHAGDGVGPVLLLVAAAHRSVLFQLR